jgi:uncharacterized membrane protein (GlpM family)
MAQMDYFFLLLKFILGGGIIVGVTWLARYVDPKYGAILVAAPITTTIAFVLTNYEAGPVITQQLVINAFYFAIPTVLFLVSLYFLMDKATFWVSLIGAFTIWLVGVLLLNRIIGGALPI